MAMETDVPDGILYTDPPADIQEAIAASQRFLEERNPAVDRTSYFSQLEEKQKAHP